MSSIPAITIDLSSLSNRGILKVIDSASRSVGDTFYLNINEDDRMVYQKLVLGNLKHFEYWRQYQNEFSKTDNTPLSTLIVNRTILGNMLVTSSGPDWSEFRQATVPLTRPDSEAFLDSLESANLSLTTALSLGSQHLQPLAYEWAVNSITRPMFCGNVANAELIWTINEFKRLTLYIMARTPFVNLTQIAECRDIQRFSQKTDWLVGVVVDNIRKGECTLIPKVLIEDSKNTSSLSHDILRSIIIGTFLIGADNLACSLVWTCIHIARSLVRNNPDSFISPEYSKACVMEALRLTPPQPLIERYLTKSTILEDYVIPDDTHIVFAPWILHRSISSWNSPLAFNPDRFICSHYSKLPFYPFGVGKRTCVGADLTVAFVSSCIAHLHRHFALSISNRTRPASLLPSFGINLTPRGDVFIDARKRDYHARER